MSENELSTARAGAEAESEAALALSEAVLRAPVLALPEYRAIPSSHITGIAGSIQFVLIRLQIGVNFIIIGCRLQHFRRIQLVG